MVKNALKNFFKNITCLFVPMGIVYLFFLLAVFIAISSLVQITGAMLSDVFALVQTSVSESSASVNDFFSYAFGQLEWNGSFIHMIVRAFQTRWLSNTVKGFFATLNVSSEGFGENFDLIVSEFMTKLRAIVSVVISLCVLGIIVANFLTRVVVRKRTAKRGVKKFIIAHTLVPLAQSVFVAASVVVLAVIRYYGLLVVAALLMLSGTFSLTASWIVHRRNGLRLKEVVTFKNIMIHLASVVVILLISAVFAGVFLVISPLLAILVMIPVVLYALNIIGINTDSMVCKMIEDRERAMSAEAPATAAPAEGVEAELATAESAGDEPAPAAPAETAGDEPAPAETAAPEGTGTPSAEA